MQRAHVALATRSAVRAASLILGLAYLSLIIGVVVLVTAPFPVYLELRGAWLSHGFQHGGGALFAGAFLGVIVASILIYSGIRSEPERRLVKRLAQRRRASRIRLLDRMQANGALSRVDRLVAYPDRKPSLLLRAMGLRRRVSAVENVAVTASLLTALGVIGFVLSVVVLNVWAPSIMEGTTLSIPQFHTTVQSAGPAPTALPHTNRL